MISKVTRIHVVTRQPGNEGRDGLRAGDIVELETPTGFIREVDPKTRTVTERRKRFIVRGDKERGFSVEPVYQRVDKVVI